MYNLIAHGALEAPLVPLMPPSQPLLGSVDRLPTLRALRHLDRLERHVRFLSAPYPFDCLLLYPFSALEGKHPIFRSESRVLSPTALIIKVFSGEGRE